jgi:hypothetical protein
MAGSWGWSLKAPLLPSLSASMYSALTVAPGALSSRLLRGWTRSLYLSLRDLIVVFSCDNRCTAGHEQPNTTAVQGIIPETYIIVDLRMNAVILIQIDSQYYGV